MCKILTPKEKESLNKLTRLVESLTKKKVVLESKPDCHCCDKKSLKETLDQSYSDMEDLAEAIINKYNITDIGVDTDIRNTILSIGRKSDKINRIASILNTGVGEIEVLFSDYNLNESTVLQLDSQKSYDLNNLQIEKVRENTYTVKLNNEIIGSIRLNQNVINLDSNKTGKTRTELYYTLSWDRDACKNIFGVEFHNGSRKEEGKVNAVNYRVGKTTYKENPFTIKKIKKYLEQELERLKSKTMKESKQEERFVGYEIKCIDSEGELRALLEYIKSNGNTGHSFGIVVDEEENKKDFFWDGDGADRIESITPIKEKKKNLKEGVWALPKDAVARRKAMNFKQELQRIKSEIYDIAGSDELFDALGNAIKELDNLITTGKSQGSV